MRRLIIPMLLAAAATFAVAPHADADATDSPDLQLNEDIRAVDDGGDELVALQLARVMVHEAGWDAGDRFADHAAIGHVLERRRQARGDEDLLDTIHAYTRGELDAPSTPRARWIAALPSDGLTRPRGFPGRLSWARHARWWRRVHERAQAFVAGELPNPCPGAEHWGAPSLERPGWARARCARPSLNVFWAGGPNEELRG